HRMRSSILEEAFEFLARIHERPSATRIAPGAGHAGLFRDLCRRHSIRGNDVYDAFLAALALEHRATLVTHDRGFLRFEGMSLFDPLAMPGMDEAGIAYRARRRKRA
ncbi:MAG: PIN domain-containing protein, partial [Alphaproteobacteria bacterium]|nr:PIN domain-containing protein [Alphaproteobacteria bacterium]